MVSPICKCIFEPKAVEITVSKGKYYISRSYLNFNQDKFIKAFNSIIKKYYPTLCFYFAPVNPLSIGHLFKFKDRLPGVVYQFNCSKCSLRTVALYIGCTERILRVRVVGYPLSLSHGTNDPLNTKKKISHSGPH